jgi:hypothetical protein
MSSRTAHVAIWQPGFFHAPGLTLFYRLPGIMAGS